MTFSVNGIKQEKNDKYTIELLVCTDAILLARKILEKHNILILSLKEFPQDKKLFGDIHFTIKLNFQEIEIVTKYTDIQAACDFFMSVGFDIVDINSYSKPLAAKDISLIITTARAATAKKKSEVREQIQRQEAQEKEVYADDRLESAKKILVRVFEKIDETLKRATGKISVQDIKKIKSLTEELRKQRMGTNFEKIRITVQEVFAIIERVNADYYASMQDRNATILPDSLVTSVDVDKELERMENVKILKSLGAKISLKNQDYATFGSSAIYRKFLQRDFLLKLADLGGLLYSFIDLAEFVVLIIIALLGTYTIGNQIYLFSTNQYGLAYSLISMGIRGLVIFIARYFRNTSIFRSLIVIALAIGVHRVMMRVITTNFAL